VDTSGFPVIEFTLFGDHDFTYTLTSPAVNDTYTFSGILTDDGLIDHTVGGDTVLTVESPGEELQANAHGDYSAEEDELIVLSGSASGGVSPYTYEWDLNYDNGFDVDATGASPSVSWDTAGVYTVALRVTDSDSPSNQHIDTATATVTEPITGAYATRGLPVSVEPSTSFDVSIGAYDYGSFGEVTETVPSGCAYVTSSLPGYQVDTSGFPVIEFTLFGDHDFTYTLTSPAVNDTYTFSGVLTDDTLTEYPVTGDIQMHVGIQPWDINMDGDVNVLDMILVGQHWGETGTPGNIPSTEDYNCDISGPTEGTSDGIVNSYDMAWIVTHWTG
jgi:hypothetical protein